MLWKKFLKCYALIWIHWFCDGLYCNQQNFNSGLSDMCYSDGCTCPESCSGQPSPTAGNSPPTHSARGGHSHHLQPWRLTTATGPSAAVSATTCAGKASFYHRHVVIKKIILFGIYSVITMFPSDIMSISCLYYELSSASLFADAFDLLHT